MKSDICRELYEYWNRLRDGAQAPRRSAIEPAAIRRALGDTFILEVIDRRTLRYRLAGTRLCGAYGREMKGANFLDLWRKADRNAIATLLAAVADDGAAAAIGLTGHAGGTRAVACEMLVLPLRQDGPGFDRVLGGMAPMERPYWLGTDPILEQRVTSMRLIWPDQEPRFAAQLQPARPVAVPAIAAADATPAALRSRFVVLDGGKR